MAASFRTFLRTGLPVAILLSFAAFFSGGPAASQTVSCAVASTPAEFAVCNSETLQVLDEKVDAAFDAAFASAGDRASRQQLTQQQSRWIDDREACKADPSCLEQRYEDRLGELSGRPAASNVPVSTFTRFASGG